MPQSWANAVIARQIIASASSIGANIAEGHGRFTFGAHRNHLSIAKGSAAETDSWLDLMRREQVITEAEEQRLRERCSELTVMLTSKIRELERLEKGGSDRIGESPEVYGADEEPVGPVPPFSEDDYS
jgi:four helix bundle protein